MTTKKSSSPPPPPAKPAPTSPPPPAPTKPASAAADPLAPIQVKALKDGYYLDIYRKAGEVFMLVPRQRAKGKPPLTPREQFTSTWMTEDLRAAPAPAPPLPYMPGEGTQAPADDDEDVI